MLLLILGCVGYLGWRVSLIAAAENQSRCADLARGQALVGSLNAMVARSNRCPTAELQGLAKAASAGPGKRSEWDIRIDGKDCRYTLAAFTVPAWPISASVRLVYDSRLGKWESVCEGRRSSPRCP
jgi:hypothetical protein